MRIMLLKSEILHPVNRFIPTRHDPHPIGGVSLFGGAMNNTVERVRLGSVVLFRWVCHKCNEEQFEGTTVCPKCKIDAGKHDAVRTVVGAKRKSPPAKVRKEILANQDHKCAWCGRPFGASYWDGKRQKYAELRIHWDHILPYSVTEDNSQENFTAACSVCNGIKSSKVFSNPRDLAVYIDRKWRLKLSKEHIVFDVEYLNTFGVAYIPDG